MRPAIVWAVGRLGARTPLYGPLNAVVPAETAAAWLKRLIDSFGGDPAGPLAVMQIARKTDDRYRDLTQKQRDAAAAAYLRKENAPSHFVDARSKRRPSRPRGARARLWRIVAEGAEDGVALNPTLRPAYFNPFRNFWSSSESFAMSTSLDEPSDFSSFTCVGLSPTSLALRT